MLPSTVTRRAREQCSCVICDSVLDRMDLGSQVEMFTFVWLVVGSEALTFDALPPWGPSMRPKITSCYSLGAKCLGCL